MAKQSVPGAKSVSWSLTQKENEKWMINMPMSFLDEAETAEEAIANAKAKNAWLFANA
jgi:hypothetical protein